jgi:hypothetical protein
MKSRLAFLVVLATVAVGAISCTEQKGPVREVVSNKDIYREAYVYAFPMIAANKALYQFN